MKIIRVLDIPVCERRRLTGKSVSESPRRSIELSFERSDNCGGCPFLRPCRPLRHPFRFQPNPPGILASVRRGGMAEKTAKCEAYAKIGSLI